jgi:transposase InsO family protein
VRVSASEKLELIHLVEGSSLSVRRTLAEIGLPRSTFYAWYKRYLDGGPAALEDRKPRPRAVWNRIPERIRAKVVETALLHTELSPRELACRITDREGEFLSESSVYRILRVADLIESPAYILLQSADRFQNPTRGRNELWQTDFTYLPVVGWGWYYLSTVLDDYSRKILAWKLGATMRVEDVTETLDLARAATGVDRVRVEHKPRLLSDNGPCYLAKDLAAYLEEHAGTALPPDDAGQDRALPPLDEERGPTRKLLQPLGTGASHCSLRRLLQPRAASRGGRQRDAGRYVPRSPVCDPEPQGEDQTLDIGTTEERESTQRGIAANGSRNSLQENSPAV